MMVTFVNFLTVADMYKLRMLNTATYSATADILDKDLKRSKQAGVAKNQVISLFHKQNFQDIIKYLRRIGNL